MRHPLAVQSFMGGNRQKWALILIICGIGVMMADIFTDIEPAAYLGFLTTIGTVFIVGMVMDSRSKIEKAELGMVMEARGKIEKAEPPAPDNPQPPTK